ncbi:MAG TPA: hypothetical protein VFM58_11240 [Solirubrobacteraceae bacterium]|jgi:hypothetical protein|nr:hypothetical protein [Solirubrobacteraceae bacterium]
MRKLIPLVTAVAVAVPATAAAAAPPFLKVTPKRIHLGETTTITGRQWPVIEFCKRRVRLRLESDQNAVLIGFKRIDDNGRFSRRFTPKAGKIGAGRWRVVARLRCESGEDGSPNFITRKRKLRILR